MQNYRSRDIITSRVAELDESSFSVKSVSIRHLISRDIQTNLNDNYSEHSGLVCAWYNETPILPSLSVARRINFVIKRLFDVIASAIGLIILAPLFLFITLIIKLTSKGSVFFRQERVGYKGQSFKIFKFRTMYYHRADISGVEQTKKGDCRVTKVGKILRKTSFDELPQLINVLRGEMSFVGPRPFVKGQLAAGVPYKQIVPYYDMRHEVIPGITGWAQANGYRGPTDKQSDSIARIEHDMAYIQNMSIWLDIKIIFLTAMHEFISGNGH